MILPIRQTFSKTIRALFPPCWPNRATATVNNTMPENTVTPADADPGFYGGTLIREAADINATIDPQVGFELSGIREALNEFCASHEAATDRCTIGFFIYFYDTNGIALPSIDKIEVKKLEMVFPDDPPSNDHWLSRLADAKGQLELNDTCVSVIGHRIYQYHRPGDNFGKPNTTAASQPVVSLADASSYGISTIKGYQPSLRIAYLDFGTLLHMLMSYQQANETELKFLFTGAEINHGEMVSPFFQTERFRDWAPDLNGSDPSVTATLKMEGIYKEKDGSDYISAQSHPYHLAESGNITLPGVTVLAPCRRYWHTVDRILNNSSSQVEINDPVTFRNRQLGLKKLSAILTEDNLRTVLGNVLGDRA